MSFVDALPAFRTKQWQVVALLFIDALSVCRLPALISYMTDRRASFHRVRTFVYIILIYYFIYMMDRRKLFAVHEALYNDVGLYIDRCIPLLRHMIFWLG